MSSSATTNTTTTTSSTTNTSSSPPTTATKAPKKRKRKASIHSNRSFPPSAASSSPSLLGPNGTGLVIDLAETTGNNHSRPYNDEDSIDPMVPRNEQESRLLAGVLQKQQSHNLTSIGSIVPSMNSNPNIHKHHKNNNNSSNHQTTTNNKRQQYEILRAIRRLVVLQNQALAASSATPSAPPSAAAALTSVVTVDLVLSEIYQYRILMEEARQMDCARLASEQQHEEEVIRQRRELRSTLEQATWEEWQTQYFPRSVILSHPSCVEALAALVNVNDVDVMESSSPPDLKSIVLRLLRLEQKANRWYAQLSQTYFQETVCPAIVDAATTTTTMGASSSAADQSSRTVNLRACLIQAVQRIEKAMFCLSGK